MYMFIYIYTDIYRTLASAHILSFANTDGLSKIAAPKVYRTHSQRRQQKNNRPSVRGLCNSLIDPQPEVEVV